MLAGLLVFKSECLHGKDEKNKRKFQHSNIVRNLLFNQYRNIVFCIEVILHSSLKLWNPTDFIKYYLVHLRSFDLFEAMRHYLPLCIYCNISRGVSCLWIQNYRGSSPYANFISANFITAIFQNFPDIFSQCVFRVKIFHYVLQFLWYN